MNRLLFLLLALYHVCTNPACHTVNALALTLSDSDIVKQQLGYLPPNFLSVSARTATGTPIAIKTYPLQKKTKQQQQQQTKDAANLGTPFPTLYWLTNPDIARAIGELERMGYIRELEESLSQDAGKRQDLLASHRQCAQERWDTLDESDRDLLSDCENDPTLQRMRQMLYSSGISGTKTQTDSDGMLLEASIKCLHTHYAHFRSTCLLTMPSTNDNDHVENPVGRMTHELLQTKFPSLEL